MTITFFILLASICWYYKKSLFVRQQNRDKLWTKFLLEDKKNLTVNYTFPDNINSSDWLTTFLPNNSKMLAMSFSSASTTNDHVVMRQPRLRLALRTC